MNTQHRQNKLINYFKKIQSAGVGGAVPRWWRNRTGRPVSPPEIHRKIIWTLSEYYKTNSECWQMTPGTQKGSPLSSKGERRDPAPPTRIPMQASLTRKPWQAIHPTPPTGRNLHNKEEPQTSSIQKGHPKHSNLNKMKRQRNIQQVKEHDKCPPNQTKEEEIGSLPEKEFRIMIVNNISIKKKKKKMRGYRQTD